MRFDVCFMTITFLRFHVFKVNVPQKLSKNCVLMWHFSLKPFVWNKSEFWKIFQRKIFLKKTLGNIFSNEKTIYCLPILHLSIVAFTNNKHLHCRLTIVLFYHTPSFCIWWIYASPWRICLRFVCWPAKMTEA